MPICINCGDHFKIKFRSNEKYCSKKCSQQYYRSNNKEPRICVICGKELPPRRVSYCSDECRRKGQISWLANRHKEEYKKPEAETKPKKKKRTKLKKGERLQDINALARAEGLTYGQYCAKHGLYY